MTSRIDFYKASPDAIKALAALEVAIGKVGLDPLLLDLVKLRASQINGCAYCVDLHSADARRQGETERRVNAVAVWCDTPFFTPRERAALGWAEALTRIAVTHAPDADYDPLSASFTDAEQVNLTLAIVSFFVIEIAGMRALGKGYINTIVYWPHDMAFAIKAPITLIMTPVEIMGKFTKPLALTIRLFANMIAGHVVVLALISIIFTFASWFLMPAPVLAATGIMLLELFVAFLQAFVFCLLVAVFIGQIRESAH